MELHTLLENIDYKKDDLYPYLFEVILLDKTKKGTSFKYADEVSVANVNNWFKKREEKVIGVRKTNYEEDLIIYYYFTPEKKYWTYFNIEEFYGSKMPLILHKAEREKELTVNLKNIISGKEFVERYVTFRDKIIMKVIYTFGSAGANMGKASYWSVTPESHDHWLYEPVYDGKVKEEWMARIKPDAKIYVQSGLAGSSGYDIPDNFYETIKKHADAAYDSDDETSGLAVYNKNILIR